MVDGAVSLESSVPETQHFHHVQFGAADTQRHHQEPISFFFKQYKVSSYFLSHFYCKTNSDANISLMIRVQNASDCTVNIKEVI